MTRLRKIYKITAAGLCAALLLAALPARLNANANSAQLSWSGTYSTGAVTTDPNCPVVVESEVLTFVIDEFPFEYYNYGEDFLEYGASVTAKYEFYNPADYAVDMTLVFPFGKLPSYGSYFPDVDYVNDTEKYVITADGSEIERTLRHTFTLSNTFDTENLAQLYDGFKEDDRFTPDARVYKYVYRLSGITNDSDYYSIVTASIGCDGVIFANYNNYEISDDTTVMWWARNDSQIEIYTLGEAQIDDWCFYLDYDRKYTTTGTATLVSCDEGTFEDLALLYYNNEIISQTDWYNAVIDKINYYDQDKVISLNNLNVDSYRLMRWYEYTLHIEPHGRVVNEVTAPVYPDISYHYEPSIYTYLYLLSPAQSWADFGAFEVYLDTPYYVTDSTLGFEKTDYGYYYRAESLPKGELEFTLSSSPTPKRIYTAWEIFFVVILILLVVPVIIPVITLIVILVSNGKKKKAKLNLRK